MRLFNAFFFSIVFSLYGFCDRFGNFYMVTDGWMDGSMDGWIDGGTNGWTMLIFYTDAIDASDNDDLSTDFAFFTKALPTDQPTDRLPRT